jgi:hypothetical protein
MEMSQAPDCLSSPTLKANEQEWSNWNSPALFGGMNPPSFSSQLIASSSQHQGIMREDMHEVETIIDLNDFDITQFEPVPLNEGRIKSVDRINHTRTSLEVLSQIFDILNERENTPASPAFPPSEQSLSMQDQPVSSKIKTEPHMLMHELGDEPLFKRQRAEKEGDSDSDPPIRFRAYQAEQWADKFYELCQFREEKGHSCVPRTFKENPALASWVKRQRYQHKLKIEGKQSTMTDERIIELEQIGFIWDSHGTAWGDRWIELKEYYYSNGHCNVPSNFHSNPKLAAWVKSQRRQYKLFRNGKIKAASSLLRRFSELQQLGFQWEIRECKGGSKEKSKDWL